MINKIKKLKLPVLFGLILSGLDLLIWIWFFYIYIMHREEVFYQEGLFFMMIIQMPTSSLMVLLGGPIVFLLSGIMPLVVAQTIILMILGLLQYFFLGYLIGKIVFWIRKHLGLVKTVLGSGLVFQHYR